MKSTLDPKCGVVFYTYGLVIWVSKNRLTSFREISAVMATLQGETLQVETTGLVMSPIFSDFWLNCIFSNCSNKIIKRKLIFVRKTSVKSSVNVSQEDFHSEINNIIQIMDLIKYVRYKNTS